MWLYLRQCLRFCTALQGSDICSFNVNSFYITELYFASCLCMNCLCFRYGEGDDENKTFHNIKELLLDCMGNPVRKYIIFFCTQHWLIFSISFFHHSFCCLSELPCRCRLPTSCVCTSDVRTVYDVWLSWCVSSVGSWMAKDKFSGAGCYRIIIFEELERQR